MKHSITLNNTNTDWSQKATHLQTVTIRLLAWNVDSLYIRI